MTSVSRHYDDHLAPIYLWMAGGLDHALRIGAADVSEFTAATGAAVDLGAGFGMHSIPLARAGYSVLAIDRCAQLLAQLRAHTGDLPVTAVLGDLEDFRQYVSGPVDLVLCMGDTLTHLPTFETVRQLLSDVAATLQPTGTFVATFRDHRHPPRGDDRFIPVRSDAERIHTCFIEAMPQRLVVHDLIHELRNGAWTMKTSSYPKLRLSSEFLSDAARAAGLECQVTVGPRGMLTFRAALSLRLTR